MHSGVLLNERSTSAAGFPKVATPHVVETSTRKIDPAEFGGHRSYLLKFAMLQVRKKEVAEDIVQEVLLAAMKGAGGFSGRSSVRTWLTAILLNKIVDYRRSAPREVSIEGLGEANGVEGIEAMFRENGSFASMPQVWRNPEDSLTDKRFLETLESCLGRLSETGRRVFLLRELMGLSVEEICAALELSTTNCSVVLHRARMRLRSCIEDGWFVKAPKP
jgi:RNA polymerase sigma-70 factor (ECF subfamily)